MCLLYNYYIILYIQFLRMLLSQYCYMHIVVKVYRTILPKLDSPGPSWYKIDAFVKETKEAIGKFKNFFTVGQAQEQEISRNGDAVSFEFHYNHD